MPQPRSATVLVAGVRNGRQRLPERSLDVRVVRINKQLTVLRSVPAPMAILVLKLVLGQRVRLAPHLSAVVGFIPPHDDLTLQSSAQQSSIGQVRRSGQFPRRFSTAFDVVYLVDLNRPRSSGSIPTAGNVSRKHSAEPADCRSCGQKVMSRSVFAMGTRVVLADDWQTARL